MAINLQAVLTQIDDLIAELEKFSKYRSPREIGYRYTGVPTSELAEFLTRVVAGIERIAPPNSAYLETLKTSTDGLNPLIPDRIDIYLGVLKALRADYTKGYLLSVTELIHADVFSDFLEMADYLLSEEYKDPAAVIAGTVLEGHLRKLCDKSGIPTIKLTGEPKKAESMNTELATANAYSNSKLDQKSVTAWLDLRNKAAHGHYAEYTKEQVALLIQSIRDFITRNPA